MSSDRATPAGLYAFVSPDAPETVTVIASYGPDPGPEEFGDDVLYEIHIDLNGDARPDLTYQFRFRTELRDDTTVLYNKGRIDSLDSENWNRRQFYSVTGVDAQGKSTVLAPRLPCPPCNVGARSIPDYDRLAADAVVTLATGEKIFAGQRAHEQTNAHAIAIQMPIASVRGSGADAIGVWTSASRRVVHDGDRGLVVGPYEQVARLGVLSLDTSEPPGLGLGGPAIGGASPAFAGNAVLERTRAAVTFEHFPYLGTPYDGLGND